MSSSGDSDLDLEWERIIKPKKFIPKFLNSIPVYQTFTQSQDPSDSNRSYKTTSKKTKTDDSWEDKITSLTNSKFARRLPIAFNIIAEPGFFTKNVKFNLQNENTISEQRSSSSFTGTCKDNPALNIKFFQDDSDKQQGTIQICEKNRSQTKKISMMSKTCNRPCAKIRNSKTEEISTIFNGKTASVLASSHRSRTQIIKQYRTDGNTIRTNWLKGLINGYTQIDYEDKGKFRGIFQQGDILSGQLTFPNGFVYTGQFSMYAFHGLGKLKFPSGQIFQGNWIYGSLNGKGKIIYPHGQIYYGQISNFKKDGQGYLYFHNGQKYVGEFSKGHITGYGQFHKDGKMTHKGFWINGKFFHNDEQQYKKKKQQFQQEKRNKAKRLSNTSDQIEKSFKKIKQIHKVLMQGEENQQIKSRVNIMGISIKSVNQSSKINYDERRKQPRMTDPNRFKKQISLSIKLI